MHREQIVASPARRPRTRAAEHAANLALALVAIVALYFMCVGIVATAISQGWSASSGTLAPATESGAP